MQAGPRDRTAAEASQRSSVEWADAQLKAMVEAVVYVTDEPLSADQIATRSATAGREESGACWKS